jgi:hypothetical protein
MLAKQIISARRLMAAPITNANALAVVESSVRGRFKGGDLSSSG